MGGVLDLANMAGYDRDIGAGSELLGLDLVAHGLDSVGIGTDEDDPFVRETLGEARVLGQEAEAGMDRLGTRRPAGLDDLVSYQVAGGSRCRADEDALVCHLHGHGVRIGLGIDHHGGDPQPPAGPDDPHGDLAAVGNEDFPEHQAPLEQSQRTRASSTSTRGVRPLDYGHEHARNPSVSI